MFVARCQHGWRRATSPSIPPPARARMFPKNASGRSPPAPDENMRSPTRAATSGLRLAADIGGTFTDIAVFDQRTGKLTFGKVLSTPHHLVEGINAGVAKA